MLHPELVHPLMHLLTALLSQLWVFTLDLWYTSSHTSKTRNAVVRASIIPRRAIKVLWKSTPDGQHNTTESGVPNEELCIDSELVEKLHTALVQNQDLLPQSARKYRDWNVTLLHRFSREDAEQSFCSSAFVFLLSSSRCRFEGAVVKSASQFKYLQ